MRRVAKSLNTYRTVMPVDQKPVPMLANYLLCALAGTTWYFQFFFYTMGETQMGKYGFSSWTLHMASIIIFSTLWGLGFKEWRGAGGAAMRLLTLALFLLVGSTVVVGYGNFLAAAGSPLIRSARCDRCVSMQCAMHAACAGRSGEDEIENTSWGVSGVLVRL